MEIELPENFWPVIASAAGTAWPPHGGEEAHRFVEQCASEGALPLLFVSPSPSTVTDELNGWRAFDAANRHRTVTLTRTISGLPSLLGEEFILLKGSDVANRLYSSPELRPMGDIDVLVPLQAIDGITRRMISKGLRPRYTRLTHFSRRNPDLAFDLGVVTLEVHHSIVHRASARIDYAALWRARARTSVAGVDLWRLADADALIAAALTIAKDNLAAPLIRYLDLWLILRDQPQLAAEAMARARDWRVENAVYAILRIASTLFPQFRLSIESRPSLERLIVSRCGQHVSDARRIPCLTRLWRKYWLLDRIDLRVRYFAAITTAAAYGLWRRSELESPSGRLPPS